MLSAVSSPLAAGIGTGNLLVGISGLLVIAVVGILERRSPIGRKFEQLFHAEQARTAQLEQQIVDRDEVIAEKDAELLEQRELKHSALSEAAGWRAKFEIATDLTPLLKAEERQEAALRRQEAILATHRRELVGLMRAIVDRLPLSAPLVVELAPEHPDDGEDEPGR